MKRRWFLAGLALPVITVGCQAIASRAGILGFGGQGATGNRIRRDQASGATQDIDGTELKITRNSKTLVMATAANYPPYEKAEGEGEDRTITGFDIDLAELIADRMDRTLSVVDLEFGSLIPALVNDEVDIAMAALEPNRSRKQKVDFSNIYYRSRYALVSLDGYLRSRNLSYQTIGIRAGSVEARYVARIGDEDYPSLDVIAYDTLEEVFEALDIGAVEGAILEANIAKTYLRRYPDFEAQLMPSERSTGSAIALAKNSPLRRDINAALSDIKSSGDMDRLIRKWFS